MGFETQQSTGLAQKNILYADLLSIYNAGTMATGLYKITDRADAGIFVKANSSSSLDLEASAVFYNPDYQNVGVYSGVSGFAGQLGVWLSTLAPVVGNVVIYNGNHYKNLTGAVGTAPSGDAVNWAILSKSLTTGFIAETDVITYDIVADRITMRSCKRGNVMVKDATTDGIVNFQWGNNNVLGNVCEPGARILCLNNTGTIKYSHVDVSGLLTSTTNAGTISNGYIGRSTSVTALMNSGVTLDMCSWDAPTNWYTTWVMEPAISHSGGNKVTNGYSDFSVNLDMSDAAVFSAGTLTLPSANSGKYLGRCTLQNNSGQTITKIVNIGLNGRIRFTVKNGETQTFSHTAIAGATSNDLVCSAGATSYAIIGRSSGTDFIEYERTGTLNRMYNVVKLT